ncbi:hypothetical protein Droror1_Dr00004617 [Drosera rotundifolia]
MQAAPNRWKRLGIAMWTILASTMQRLGMELTDLPSDIVRDIVIRVAKSSGGAADMASLICTCKTMYEFVEDIDVLKAVCFDRLVLSVHFNSLRKYKSLLTRCAGHTDDCDSDFDQHRGGMTSKCRSNDIYEGTSTWHVW